MMLRFPRRSIFATPFLPRPVFAVCLRPDPPIQSGSASLIIPAVGSGRANGYPKAGEYVEKFQMYQLESLSAAKFYECGPQASRAFSLGQLVLRQQMSKPQ